MSSSSRLPRLLSSAIVAASASTACQAVIGSDYEAPRTKLDDDVPTWSATSDAGNREGRADAANVTVPLDRVPLAVGNGHGCAVTSAGGVRCWGVSAGSESPVEISGLSDVVSVVADDGYACALAKAGTVHCWGKNVDGRLGDGTLDDHATPRAVVGITDARALRGGAAHVCAVLATGHVACWGANDAGQLGDGSRASHAAPVVVAGIDDAVAIATGAKQACALRAGGSVACWGSRTDVPR